MLRACAYPCLKRINDTLEKIAFDTSNSSFCYLNIYYILNIQIFNEQNFYYLDFVYPILLSRINTKFLNYHYLNYYYYYKKPLPNFRGW